jgi:hypothetical protein
VALIAGSALPRPAFIGINAAAMLTMVVAVRATVVSENNGWMGIAIATVLFINGIAHVAGSLLTARYSPGLVTGVILYLPLAQLTLMRAWLQAQPGLFGRGIVVGVAVHALVGVIAFVTTTVG